ncbi:CDP-Glycerol:Poly(glycerophosphate) glycerophosphotransferase [bacterium BMS3Bbin04]|nr:CDP-Glycerol:Poly(glycerophosphate) glycerophosphotransferase [bacterium BMS3Bbin04]
MPSLDPLFGGWVAKRDHLREQLKLAPGQKAILYAPTWNPELSSVPLLWTRIRSLATPQHVVILRPHPYLPDDYQKACEQLVMTDANIRLAREPDLQPYLQVADLVISDTSSVAWEAALLDKPVIRVDTPNRSEYKQLDPSDPEYQFTSFAPVVRDLEELRESVHAQLANPAQFHEARMRLREPLLASTDGTSCQQVLTATMDLIGGGSSIGRLESAGVCVVLDARSAMEASVEASLESILDHGRESVQVRLIGADRIEPDTIDQWRSRWPDRLTVEMNLQAAINSEQPFVLMMVAGVFGTSGWLFRLTNHLRRHEGLIAIAPMAIGGRPVQEPHIRIQQTESSAITFEDIDHTVRFKQAGELLDPGQAPAADAILLRKKSPLFGTLSDRWLKRQWAEPSEKVPVGIAADVVVHFSTRELALDSNPLLNGQGAAAEERLRELSQWIQRSMPAHVRRSASSTSGRTSPPLAELPGPLRLATHYLEQGKLDRATQMVKRAQRDFPNHSQTLALMERLGISNPASMTSGTEWES